MTLTVADLDNAKLDVEHIEAIATSSELTATDRLGQTKATVAGKLAEIDEEFLGATGAISFIYQGTYASEPLTRPDGSARQPGDLYFNAATLLNYRWSGSSWVASDLTTADLAAPGGANLVGYVLSYPGVGAVAGDVQAVLDEHVNVHRFGVKTGNAGAANTANMQTAIQAAAANGFALELPFEDLAFAGPVYMDHTLVVDQHGVSIRGQVTRKTKIIYSGSGHWLNVTGLGTEGGTPITQFDLSNFRVTAANSATPVGAIYLDRVNRVKLYGVSADSFANASSRVIEIRNFFNVELEKFNISGGASLPQGQYGLVYGSKDSGAGDNWNSSNLRVHNGLIQRMAGKGAVVVHDNNILDNVEFSHVSFGANSLGSFSAVSDKAHNIGVRHCHFESAGIQPGGSYVAAEHIYMDQISGALVENNEMKDASVHVHLHRTKGFKVDANTLYESGSYTVGTSKGVQISGDAATGSIGAVGPNNIYTTQIDTPYEVDQYSSVDPGGRQVTEAAWSSVYAGEPGYYGKSVLVRKELSASNPDAEFSQAWLSPATRWLRVMLSTRHVGWGTSFPVSGSYTAGDIVLNETPSVTGTTPYTTLGWRRLTTGSAHVAGTDWVSLRCLSGTVAFTSSYNGAEPLKMGGYYLWIDASSRLRLKLGAPASDTDGTVVGTQA